MVKSRKQHRKRKRIKRLILFFVYKTFFNHDDIVLKIIFISLIIMLIFTVNALQEQGVFVMYFLRTFGVLSTQYYINIIKL